MSGLLAIGGRCLNHTALKFQKDFGPAMTDLVARPLSLVAPWAGYLQVTLPAPLATLSGHMNVFKMVYEAGEAIPAGIGAATAKLPMAMKKYVLELQDGTHRLAYYRFSIGEVALKRLAPYAFFTVSACELAGYAADIGAIALKGLRGRVVGLTMCAATMALAAPGIVEEGRFLYNAVYHLPAGSTLTPAVKDDATPTEDLPAKSKVAWQEIALSVIKIVSHAAFIALSVVFGALALGYNVPQKELAKLVVLTAIALLPRIADYWEHVMVKPLVTRQVTTPAVVIEGR